MNNSHLRFVSNRMARDDIQAPLTIEDAAIMMRRISDSPTFMHMLLASQHDSDTYRDALSEKRFLFYADLSIFEDGVNCSETERRECYQEWLAFDFTY